jgi:hypothetical protein
MRTNAWILLVALVLIPVRGLAQAGWFPANARAGVARDLALRLEKVGLDIEQDQLMPAARAGVEEMGLRLETIGEKKLMDLAPRFPQLDLPVAGQPHLDAMARLGVCTYYLEARFAKPSGADVDERLNAAMGPPMLALSTMYLRHFYLAEGGTDKAIRDYLMGDSLNTVVFEVQQTPELLKYTATECRAVVSALID